MNGDLSSCKQIDKEGEKMTTIYGYNEIYNFVNNNTKLVHTGHGNEYRYNNVLIILEKYCFQIRIYTDYTKNTCVASVILYYNDFAIQYDATDSNITLLSRHGEKVSGEMYISLKNIMA
jgi:hypothetical protein